MTFKVIIAGSRDITDLTVVQLAHANAMKVWWDEQVMKPLVEWEVVSGGARGVDQLGEELGRLLSLPVKRFPAAWSKLGKVAGLTRNKQMAEYADALIAVWDGASRGTGHMITTMNRLGKPVYIHIPEKKTHGN